jgi:hypothetical protein
VNVVNRVACLRRMVLEPLLISNPSVSVAMSNTVQPITERHPIRNTVSRVVDTCESMRSEG